MASGTRFSLFRILTFCFLLGLQSGCAVMARGTVYESRRAEALAPDGAERELRGVFHVHTVYSGDSYASLDFVVKTAEKAGLDFVVVTDHNTLEGAAVYASGDYPEHPLLLFGTEHSRYEKTPEGKKPFGHMVSFGIGEAAPKGLSNQELVDWVHTRGGYVVLSHAFGIRNPWRDWNLNAVDGIEMYNFAHSLYEQNKLTLAMRTFRSPKGFLKASQKTPEKRMRAWQEKWPRYRAAAFGASDAHLHANFLGLKPESYLLYFQAVTTYVRSDGFSETKIAQALGEGRSFIAFEAFGEARGFEFKLVQGNRVFRSGDTVNAASPVTFEINVPGEAEIRLLKNGEILHRREGRLLRAPAEGPGAYHAEAYRGGALWIFANPIEVGEAR